MAARPERDQARQSGFAPALLVCAALASACGLETRGPVLFERRDAGADAASCGAAEAACGAQVELRGDIATASEGGDGGSPHRDLCPDEQILIGYSGTLRQISVTADDIVVLGSLEGVCGRLSMAANAIAVSAAEPLPTRGEPDGAYGDWTRVCPADHALVGAFGRAGLAVDQLTLLCARFGLEGASETIVVESETTLPSIGGSGGAEFEARCPAGQVARGHDVRAGRWLDAFGLVCATPAFVP